MIRLSPKPSTLHMRDCTAPRLQSCASMPAALPTVAATGRSRTRGHDMGTPTHDNELSICAQSPQERSTCCKPCYHGTVPTWHTGASSCTRAPPLSTSHVHEAHGDNQCSCASKDSFPRHMTLETASFIGRPTPGALSQDPSEPERIHHSQPLRLRLPRHAAGAAADAAPQPCRRCRPACQARH
jgi:hypothetical protein